MNRTTLIVVLVLALAVPLANAKGHKAAATTEKATSTAKAAKPAQSFGERMAAARAAKKSK